MSIERNERSDFGCLLKLWGTRVCLANFVNQSGFRKLAANQSQVEGNRGKNVGYLDMQLKSLLSFISMDRVTKIRQLSSVNMAVMTSVCAANEKCSPWETRKKAFLVAAHFHLATKMHARLSSMLCFQFRQLTQHENGEFELNFPS